LYLGITGGKGYSVRHFSIETDLKGVLPGPGKGHVEDQHRTSLHVDDPSGRLSELHGALAPEELASALIDEADPNRVHADLGAAPPDPEHQMGAGIHRGKVRQPDVLKHAEHAELALLIDQGIVGDYREIEVQGSGDSD
jgi:hypothetical protein